MTEIDKRILMLLSILLETKKIRFKVHFYETIKTTKQSITKIKNGNLHFTVKQIELICKNYNVNANWIFGIEKNIFITPKNQ